MPDSSNPSPLLLPGDPGFDEILGHTLPIDWQQVAYENFGEYAFVVRPGSGGLMECVPVEEATEYVFGGEYDERLEEIEEYEDAYFF